MAGIAHYNRQPVGQKVGTDQIHEIDYPQQQRTDGHAITK